MKLYTSFIILFALSYTCVAQKKIVPIPTNQIKEEAAINIQSNYELYKKVALDIWNFAESGFKENKSSTLLQNTLRENGFTVDAGIAGMPTAFVASYGSGKPVIALLAEFDALPGLSQDSSSTKSPVADKINGHACGHHLFGAGSVASAIAIKTLLKEGKIKGTIKLFGSPAEEGGGGKVYLVRAGLFNDVDIALHWHPGARNAVTFSSALAYKSAKFRFHGLSAHASASPERGRSALDAVEGMDYMVNMMREHIPQETRIHYVITNGGKAPNVVPDFAEVFYYVRNPERTLVESIFDRVVKTAEGAAIGTETKMDYEVIDGTHDLLINKTLALNMQANLEKVGGITYTPDELIFGKQLQSTFSGKIPSLDSASFIKPLESEKNQGSTDVGDVSYVVPTVGLTTATWIPGTPAHSWQAAACGGKDMAIRATVLASKALAYTAIDLFSDPLLITKAKEEFKLSIGDYQYKALLGDRKPALNYRD
jgi:aminobenzoyl-glutamate utilization protein B